MIKHLKLFAPVLLLPSALPAGEPVAPQPQSVMSQWALTLDAGYLHQVDSDIDSGGSFSVDRANLDFGVTRVFGPGRVVGVSLGYGYRDYTFESMRTDPWGEVHALTLAFPVQWALNERWSFFALPAVRANFEQGAEISDGLTGGLLAGATYKFGGRLTVGPGIGISSELEDSLNVFPILLIKWTITDTLELKTARGLGASQGPGLTLTWQAAEKWKISLGTGYERLRFRLNDRGSVPGGVGEEKGVPVYLGASYALGDDSEISVYAGMKFGGSLEIDDKSGNNVYQSDHDAAPFFGFSWNAKF